GVRLELVAAVGGAGSGVADLHPVLRDVAGPLVDGVLGPGGSGAGDRRVLRRHGRLRGRELRAEQAEGGGEEQQPAARRSTAPLGWAGHDEGSIGSDRSAWRCAKRSWTRLEAAA